MADNVLSMEAHRNSVRAASKVIAAAYLDAVARLITHSLMADGTKDAKGKKLCRNYNEGESRYAAIDIIGNFFIAMLQHRVKLEAKHGGVTETSGRFIYAARTRLAHYWRDNVGKSHNLVTERQDMEEIEKLHGVMSEAVFALLQQQVNTKADFYEPKFWFDVARGFGDADMTGVVGRALGMVLLDHRASFGAALLTDRNSTLGFSPVFED